MAFDFRTGEAVRLNADLTPTAKPSYEWGDRATIEYERDFKP